MKRLSTSVSLAKAGEALNEVLAESAKQQNRPSDLTVASCLLKARGLLLPGSPALLDELEDKTASIGYVLPGSSLMFWRRRCGWDLHAAARVARSPRMDARGPWMADKWRKPADVSVADTQLGRSSGRDVRVKN